MQRALISGGAGFLGQNMARALDAAGVEVVILDIRAPDAAAALSDKVVVIVGDLTNAADVAKAMKGCDVVFHTASVIDTMSLWAVTAARKAFVDKVNVGGTQTLLDAAEASPTVRRFIYTSSVNAVAMDRPHYGDDEEAAAVGSGQAADLYTLTKGEAERRVLAADDAGSLRCCALRPGGIYGPGEGQHFPRVVKAVKGGQFQVAVGSGKADNIYVDDLVSAHLAAERALATKVCKAGGRAYFVNDGQPQSYFELFQPVATALGVAKPKYGPLPARLMYAVCALAEAAHRLGAPYPFLTVTECAKLMDDHWYSIEGAKRDLGWVPEVGPEEGFRRCLPWIKQVDANTQVAFRLPSLETIMFFVVALVVWLVAKFMQG